MSRIQISCMGSVIEHHVRTQPLLGTLGSHAQGLVTSQEIPVEEGRWERDSDIPLLHNARLIKKNKRFLLSFLELYISLGVWGYYIIIYKSSHYTPQKWLSLRSPITSSLPNIMGNIVFFLFFLFFFLFFPTFWYSVECTTINFSSWRLPPWFS